MQYQYVPTSWRRRIRLELAVAEGAGVDGLDLAAGAEFLEGVAAMTAYCCSVPLMFLSHSRCRRYRCRCRRHRWNAVKLDHVT